MPNLYFKQSFFKFLLSAILFFSYLGYSPGQCLGNLINNGSFTGTEGFNLCAPGWTKGNNTNNTPDINDANGQLNSSPTYIWTGTPIPSSDGGTWQNLCSQNESVEQTVFVVPGQSYKLQFEYATQSIHSPVLNYSGPVGVNLFFNGILVFNAADDNTDYTWETACYSFVATGSIIIIRLSPSTPLYVGIDGICLSPSNENIGILGNDTTICKGTSLTLNATTPNASYHWQDNSASPTYNVTEQGNYSVEIKVGNCKQTDQINVNTEECSIILMPNVFTPNEDGLNEYFLPIEIKNINQAILIIYDRWGQKIFESTDLLNGWNGKYKNNDCVDGVYYWTIQYQTIADETIFTKGFITLIN